MNALLQESSLPVEAQAAAQVADASPPVPLPSIVSIPATRSSSTLTQVICDDRAIGRLLETLLWRAGLSINEAARRLGIDPSSVRQYTSGRRGKPSLLWFIRFVTLCGGRLNLEMPERGSGSGRPSL